MNSMILSLILALFNVFVLSCLAYYWGYQKAKHKKFVQIGTIDELVQNATNKSLLRVGRTDQVNVADIECYIAIMHKDEVTLINLDRYL